jgi:predicted ester cyclase
MSIDDTKRIVRQLEAALQTGVVDAGLELFAEELTYNGQRMSRDQLVQVRAPLWAAVPDVRWTIEELVAEGDTVASLLVVTSTHTADFDYPGLGRAPASGNPIRYHYMVMHRIVDGRIVEARDVSDRLTLLQQLGVLAAPGQGGA